MPSEKTSKAILAPIPIIPILIVVSNKRLLLLILDPPEIDKDNIQTDVKASTGGKVLLKCIASGYPEPKITWRHNNIEWVIPVFYYVLKASDLHLTVLEKSTLVSKLLNALECKLCYLNTIHIKVVQCL